MKNILFLFSLLFVCARSEVVYISQGGGGDGSSTSSRLSAAQFNNAANWGAGAGKISSGDTASLGGNITTPLVIQASGTSGNIITVLFESGATMSKGHWNQNGANGDSAIYANGKNFVTIDLGSNGVIECTSNGTGLTTSLDCTGIVVVGCSNITIRNGTIHRFYVRTQGAEQNYFGGSINFDDSGGSTNLLIDNVTMANAGTLVNLTYRSTTNFEMRNCRLSSSGICVNLGSAGVGATSSGLYLHGNTYSMDLSWTGSGGLVHKDLIHAFAYADGSSMYGLVIDGETCTGDMGTDSTGFCYIEGYVYGGKIINSTFIPDNANFTGNGTVALKGCQDMLVANNFFKGTANSGTAFGTTDFGALGTGNRFINNISIDFGNLIYDNGRSLVESDHNIFIHGDNSGFSGKDLSNAFSPFNNFAQWQALGYDANSVCVTIAAYPTGSPILDGNFVPTGADTVARNAGKSLSADFTTSKSGVARPQQGFWDIGPNEYDAGGGGGGSYPSIFRKKKSIL